MNDEVEKSDELTMKQFFEDKKRIKESIEDMLTEFSGKYSASYIGLDTGIHRSDTGVVVKFDVNIKVEL